MKVQKNGEHRSYELAKEKYAELNVDSDAVLERLRAVSLSIHCWQADDVGGFEHEGAELKGGGIQVTGNYPGKPRNLAEMRTDLEKAFSLIPGTHRLSLHASYGDMAAATGRAGSSKPDRDAIRPELFDTWLEWGQQQGVKLDFNATLFSHPQAESGFTLSSLNPAIRNFWIEHVNRTREISAYIGKKQDSPCIHNLWIPDGSKDISLDRAAHRSHLKNSLDQIFETKFSPALLKDAVESKLFGIGSEFFVVGSHEFYLGYAQSRGKLLCLDMGHFHPTESVADKISSYFQFQNELLLHITRALRWDSDHVVIFNDDVSQVMQELIRSQVLDKTYIGLDFFDATMNRIGAYTIGARSALKALLFALLEPVAQIRQYGDNMFARLALLERTKTLPWGDVWNEHCRRMAVASDAELINEVMNYESEVLSRRS